MAEEGFAVSIIEEAIRKFGRIDYLVNNAFSFISKGPGCNYSGWQRVFNVGPTHTREWEL